MRAFAGDAGQARLAQGGLALQTVMAGPRGGVGRALFLQGGAQGGGLASQIVQRRQPGQGGGAFLPRGQSLFALGPDAAEGLGDGRKLAHDLAPVTLGGGQGAAGGLHGLGRQASGLAGLRMRLFRLPGLFAGLFVSLFAGPRPGLGGGVFGMQTLKPVALGQTAGGGGGGLCGGAQAIPAPQIPLSGDEPLAGQKGRLQGLARSRVIDDAGMGQTAGERLRRGDEGRKRACAIGQRRVVIQRRQIAPVNRRGGIQRRVQIIAKGGGQRGLHAGGHLQGVHQRGEEVIPRRSQHLFQRAHLGGQLLRLAAGVVPCLTGVLLRLAGLRERLFGVGGARLASLKLFSCRLQRRFGAAEAVIGGGAGVEGLLAGGGLFRFLFQTRKAAFRLLQGALQSLAAGGGAGELPLGLVGLFLNGLQLACGGLHGLRGPGAGVFSAGFALEPVFLLLQPGDGSGGVVEHVLLAGDVVLGLIEPGGQLLAASGGVLLGAAQAFQLHLEPLQHGAARGLFLAQGGEFLRQLLALARQLRGRAGELRQQAGGFVPGRAGFVQMAFRLLPGAPHSGGLHLADLRRKLAVAGRLTGLPLEAAHLRLQLAGDILQPVQIGFGGVELQLGLVAAGIEAGDAGGLLQNAAARLRLGVDDLGNAPLTHQGGRARAGGGVGEEQLHVAGAHLLAVDAVGGALVALDAARHLQRVKPGIGRRGLAGGIVDGQHHLGDIARRAAP